MLCAEDTYTEAAMSFLIALLLVPAQHCPPDVGQLRWHDIPQTIGAYSATVSVWDTNQDGVPSAGDLAHVSPPERDGQPLELLESWYKIGETFASELVAALPKDPPVCEAQPTVTTTPPPMASLKALTPRLEAAYKPLIKRAKRVEYLRSQMTRWSKNICKDKQFRSHGAVAAELVAQASRQFDDLDAETVNKTAFAVAEGDDLKCTKVSADKISF